MPRMPGAVWLGEQSPRTPMTRYDVVCVHTIAGFAPAHAAHFSVTGDGTIQQSRDTAFRSGANLHGNHRVIAIENEDHGPGFPKWTGSNVPLLTPEQVEANARILAWAHREHGIPLQLCPDSRPESRGLAYHRQGIDGNFGGYDFPGRVQGGEVWTEHFGKVCPGDRRIAQRPEILARAVEIANPADVLHVQQASLKFDEPPTEAELDAIYRRGAHVIGHTEAGNMRPRLKAACERHGYRLVQPHHDGKRVGTVFAVKLDIPVLSRSFIPVVPANPKPARDGGHDVRGVTTAGLDFHGSVLYLSEFHMITGWGQAGRDQDRDAQALGQWTATVQTTAALGRGKSVSILMGDVNYDPDDPSRDTPSEILASRGWVSAFDEVGRPDVGTHGRRTIDQVYTLAEDKRVTVKRVRVWPDSDASDHRQVSAFLEIQPSGGTR